MRTLFLMYETMEVVMDNARWQLLLVHPDPTIHALVQGAVGKWYGITIFNSFSEIPEAVPHRAFALLSTDQIEGNSTVEHFANLRRRCPKLLRLVLAHAWDQNDSVQWINHAAIDAVVTLPSSTSELLTVTNEALETYRLTASAWLADDGQLQELTAQNSALKERLASLETIDPVTRVQNARAFTDRFVQEIERSRRHKHSAILVLVEIDDFPRFLSMEGRVCGDEALRKLAHLLVTNLRKTDWVGALKEGLLAFALIETQLEGGLGLCDRVRTLVESTAFQGKNASVFLTISMGVSSYPSGGESADALFKVAESSLEQAKGLGGNRVQVSESAESADDSFFIR